MKGGTIELLLAKHAGSLEEVYGNPDKFFGEITPELMNDYLTRTKNYERFTN